MPSPTALIALLVWPSVLHLPSFGHDPQAVAGWRLSVRADSFTGGHVCKLGRRGISFTRQALVLHLARNIDTSTAYYRVDDAAPRAARDDQAVLAELGFTLFADDLNNPSQGLVRIPEPIVLNARTVRVETAAFQRPTVFRIDGLAQALSAAHAAGCRDADFQ